MAVRDMQSIFFVCVIEVLNPVLTKTAPYFGVQRIIKVPKTVSENKKIQVPRQVLEPRRITVQRPRVEMEDRQVTVQEPKTITVSRVVPVAQTIQGQRIVEKPRVVEYERPQVMPGRYVRSFRAPGVFPSGYFAGASPPGARPMSPTFNDSAPLVPQPMPGMRGTQV